MTAADTAALLVRLVIGATMAAHGYNHLWGGGGVAGTARWFASLGMRPARLHAVLSGAGELAAGAALAAGFLTPLAAAFVIGTMAVAGITAHRANGFFVFKDGYEYVLMIAVICVALALAGPGGFSLDHAIGWDGALSGGAGLAIAAGGGLAGAVLLLAATWRPGRIEQGSGHA
ncbi:DoxX family protein [Amycolatopsis sp. NPDC051128]|uniref:DoxX family protein n=1 Tax=Amycolatopsis sp. NPDC051128 TaxID=3155412 RepID=UPI0034413726